jgi:hypothetical protein
MYYETIDVGSSSVRHLPTPAPLAQEALGAKDRLRSGSGSLRADSADLQLQSASGGDEDNLQARAESGKQVRIAMHR